jgi:hypothetical protein
VGAEAGGPIGAGGAEVGGTVGVGGVGVVVPVGVPVPVPVGVPVVAVAVGVPVVGADVVGRDVVGLEVLVGLVRSELREVRLVRTGARVGPVLLGAVEVVAEVGEVVDGAATREERPVSEPAVCSAATVPLDGVPSSVDGINPLVAATAGPPTIRASTAPPTTGRRRYSGRGARCLPM